MSACASIQVAAPLRMGPGPWPGPGPGLGLDRRTLSSPVVPLLVSRYLSISNFRRVFPLPSPRTGPALSRLGLTPKEIAPRVRAA